MTPDPAAVAAAEEIVAEWERFIGVSIGDALERARLRGLITAALAAKDEEIAALRDLAVRAIPLLRGWQSQSGDYNATLDLLKDLRAALAAPEAGR